MISSIPAGSRGTAGPSIGSLCRCGSFRTAQVGGRRCEVVIGFPRNYRIVRRCSWPPKYPAAAPPGRPLRCAPSGHHLGRGKPCPSDKVGARGPFGRRCARHSSGQAMTRWRQLPPGAALSGALAVLLFVESQHAAMSLIARASYRKTGAHFSGSTDLISPTRGSSVQSKGERTPLSKRKSRRVAPAFFVRRDCAVVARTRGAFRRRF